MQSKIQKGKLIKTILLALSLSTSLFILTVQAEESPEYSLEETVVTATRIEQTAKDIPASISVITAEDIKKMNVQTIDQALRLAAGVFDNRNKGLLGTTSSVSLRGFNGQQRTLVLLDGQPLNQAYAGSVNWASIPIESVERVEIVKGSNSALYGGTAMGGVINIITKNPQQHNIQVSIKDGSYDFQDYRMDMSDKINDRWSYHFGYEKKQMGGYPSGLVTVSPSSGAGTNGVGGWTATTSNTGQPKYLVGDTGNNTWDEDTVTTKLMYQLDANRSLLFGLMHNKYSYGYGTGHDYLVNSNGTPFTSGYFSLGSGQRASISSSSFIGLPGGRETDVYTFGYKDKKNGITFNAGLNNVLSSWYISSIASAATLSSGSGRISDTPSKRWNVDLQKELYATPNDRMVVGMNYRQDWIHNQENNLSTWTNYGSITGLYSQAEGNSKTVAVFVQDEHKLNDKLSLTIGGRYDSWKTYNGLSQDNSVSVSLPVYYPDRSDSAFSPKVALMYKQSDDSRIHLSWGKAFSSPDLYNMYRAWVSYSAPPAGSTGTLYDGNPDLKPEHVSSYELGWNKKLTEKTSLNLTYFHNTITNMGYRRDLGINKPGTTYRWTVYENAGEGETNGVELEFSHRLSDCWSSFLNYTNQRPIITKNPAAPTTVGKLVQNVPQQLFNFGFNYQHDKWRGNLTGIYVSKQYGQADNSDTVSGVYGSYDPYFIANMNIEYQYNKQTSIMFGIDNLFNRQYYSYYPSTDRAYSLQVTYKF